MAGVVIPLFEKDGDIFFVLTKRTSTVKIHKGEVSFPGGMYEPKDGNTKRTAIRECCEEIGVKDTDLEIGSLVKQEGCKKVLLHYGSESARKSGLLDRVCRALAAEGIACAELGGVVPNPRLSKVYEGVELCKKEEVDFILAVGGGSVIDCGKAVSAMLASEGSVKDYLEGIGAKKPPGMKVPFVAVPTTAGTGSEATTNAVLCDRQEGYKRSLRHEAHVPDVALVDPELTISLPPALTTACGLDAAAQLIEAYTSTKTDKATDAPAIEALACVGEALPALGLGLCHDLALREKMSFAALVSGIALSRSGLGAVHGLAGPLGGLFPVPHGVACGKLLFPVMSFVVKKVLDAQDQIARKRFADIGRIFSGRGDADDTAACLAFLDVLRDWFQKLRLPPLSSFGVTCADFDRIIAAADGKNSPAALTPKEMKAVLEIAR